MNEANKDDLQVMPRFFIENDVETNKEMVEAPEVSGSYDVKDVSFDEFKELVADEEGLVFLGAGGVPAEWIEGVSTELNSQGISNTPEPEQMWSDYYKMTTSGGRTDLAFVLKEGEVIDMGKLAMWRLQFGDASWISDYLDNYADQHVEEAKKSAPKPRRSTRPLKKHGQQADAFLDARTAIEELQQQASAINAIIAEKEHVAGTLAGELMKYAEEYEDRAFQTKRILVALEDIPPHKAKVPQWKKVMDHLLNKLEGVSTEMRKEAEAFIEGAKREIPGETELLYKEIESKAITSEKAIGWAVLKGILDRVKKIGIKARYKIGSLEAEVDAFVDATEQDPAPQTA